MASVKVKPLIANLILLTLRQGVEKRHERKKDKAKIGVYALQGKKEEFTVRK